MDITKTEARLDQITDMLTELIRIVGNTNAAVEGLRKDVEGLRKDVEGLRKDVDELKSDMKEVKQTLKEHTEKLDYVLFKLAHHDADIFNLKRIKP
ncbi:hypothetical protein [Carboxydothermus hydrogenoformans]|uniref:Conserved domain protein n=1 Tax=Carboxydothermus hydrogenoformans (strain ATCC BAA-161 / DSM 6008 / Z-2901) TaxID=246194 RepID=Q3A8W2_CARHZ|nr:hypothetical protein [Carboxydothermus hydrogenoformans]ABB14644.1 conserved domain protein [Carboxydothermus hydrogenoformans Z-2901]